LILATSTVEDFDRWLKIFSTKSVETRKQHGSKGSTVFCDPNGQHAGCPGSGAVSASDSGRGNRGSIHQRFERFRKDLPAVHGNRLTSDIARFL
jgi:hypothetical protein